MKKYLIAIFGGLFLLALTLSAYADVKLQGELRERGRYQKNRSLSNDTKTDDHAYYDTRIRLGVNADVAKNIKGFIELEYDVENENWGTYTESKLTTTDTLTVTTKNTAGTTLGTGSVTDSNYDVTAGDNAKATGLFGEGNRLQSRNFSGIRQAYILYTFDMGVPAGIKVGHQLLALSHAQFFDHTRWGDSAIVFFMDPNKSTHIGLLTIKFDEGGTALGTNGDDVDGNVALMTYKLNKTDTIGANLTWVRGSKDASVRLLGTEVLLAGAKFNFYNVGLHGTHKIGSVGLKWEGDMQSGKLGDAKFKGYGVWADATMPVGGVTLVLGGAMGTGFKSGSSDIDAFVTSLGAEPHYTFVYEYFVPSALGAVSTGIANTTYGKVGAKFAASKSVSIDIDAYYLRATKTASGVSKALGTEIDGKITYKISDSLSYTIVGGYLAPGKFYEYSGSPTKGKKDSAYAVDHALVLKF